MKRHLTEKELIEYRFRLASDEQATASAEHIDGCSECRERLERLDRKFAALDLLREDAHASEELITQVLEQAKKPVKARIISFRTLRWIGAIAAVLVIGFALFIGNLPKKEQVRFAGGEKSELAVSGRSTSLEKSPVESMGRSRFTTNAPVKSMEQMKPTSEVAKDSKGGIVAGTKMEGVTVANLDSAEAKTDTFAFAVPKEGQAAGGLLGTRLQPTTAGESLSEPAMESIPEQPPFAPASAIELVTLPRRDSVQLTIYNSADLTLVRERRNLTLKKGWNWLQFMWANTLIDPTSLSLEPLEQAGKIDIQQLVFPARLRELGRWLIRSEISGQVPFEITYFTSGLSWRAFYMGTLSQDEKSMHLAGYVRINNNSGEDYENAQTRLIVGQVHLLDQIAELARRQYPYDRPGVRFGEGFDLDVGEMGGGRVITNGEVLEKYATLSFNGLKRKELRKEGLSEYFLYTIEGTETIPNEWGKRLLSFEAQDVAVESLYKYDEERWGDEAIRFVKFANDDEHNLGETPIPNGTVRIYGQADEQGSLSYVGGTDIKYIPVSEEVELNLSSARLVKVEPKLMDFKTDNYVFDNRGNVSGWDEIRTWKIEITNTRTLPIEVEITRGFDTPYWKLVYVDLASTGEDAISYEKHDATHARFTLKRRPNSKWAFTYTVTTYHGTREQAMSR